MTTSQLLVVDSLTSPMIARRAGIIRAAEFIAAINVLLKHLPAALHVINLCETRYCFLLGLVAASLREQLTLLPPNQSPGTIRDLQSQFRDCLVLDDARLTKLLDTHTTKSATSLPDWQIDGDRPIALTFTSGSTGASQVYEKTWRTLSRNAELVVAEIFGGDRAQLVATVPTQHVYGLETTAVTALTSACAVSDDKPFFPSDVRATLKIMEEPRILITTPTHLKNLIDSRVELPQLKRVVSATAPLPVDLAERIESNWHTEVHEIYGCTEAGIMARRRTVNSQPWRTFSGGNMSVTNDVVHYRAPQLRNSTPLQDVLELTSPTEFHLLGRSADMIKVGGKRTSLQMLTHELLGVTGVDDAVIFLPDVNTRPAALVVAPNVNAQTLLHELSERIDPVFLPRPLILLDKLPRNSLGKLTQDSLLQALRTHRSKKENCS